MAEQSSPGSSGGSLLLTAMAGAVLGAAGLAWWLVSEADRRRRDPARRDSARRDMERLPSAQALGAEAHELLELAEAGSGSGPGDTLPTPCRPLDPTELTAAGDDLDDRLDPEGDFDPERWLFEQLSLRLPLVNRCGSECPGPATWSSEEGRGDPRWASLRHLTES